MEERWTQSFKRHSEFLKLVRKWFDVVNVKSPFIHKRLSDSIRKPVTRDCKDGLAYLQGIESMINRWIERDGRVNKISTDTLKWTSYTCRSLIGLANYLLEEHGGLCVILARFNTTESKDTLAIYESSLAVTTGQVWNSSWKGRRHQSKKSGISVWLFSKRSIKSRERS